MWNPTLIALLCLTIAFTNQAQAAKATSSYSGEYGGGGGKRFSFSGNQIYGPITAMRVRSSSFYITGLQVRFGQVWSNTVGGRIGNLEEVFLHPGEHIIQAYGKYTSHVRQIVFVTNKGRQFPFGKSKGTSFNAAPLYPNTALRFFSGSESSAIDAIGFHWDVADSGCVHCAK
ncbi:zymogen granule membrane protein 16-like [Protopterus annectens]|uniref:zymogen granule membrane protein 16-like n=1 Tax=Protopterus annectens TaxID=7888 RepID=UPI001CFC240B|nr:zymogen granule membrane protein 16-like [Protopterus annectens]XP_043943867.1 zymogen granule membrane protein 16-like [Protopterus annectens]